MTEQKEKKSRGVIFLTYAAYVLLVLSSLLTIVIQQERINNANARYATLFEAYVEVTRDCADAEDCETDAPAPSEVPSEPIVGATGDRGAPGRDGQNATDEQILGAIERYCALDNCVGAPGSDSVTPGPQGPPGRDGADSTIPGPQGIQGEPGPTCPEGTTITNAYVYTQADPVAIPELTPVVVCVAN